MPETPPSPSWGDSTVGTTGVCVISLYLVGAFIFLLFSLARAWPPIDLCNDGAPAAARAKPAAAAKAPEQPGQPNPSAQPGPVQPPQQPAAGEMPASGQNAAALNETRDNPSPNNNVVTPAPKGGVKPDEATKPSVPDRTLLCLVAIVGALGALIHAMRSFYAFVGNGQLKYCWLPMYILLPCIGSALALIFFLILKGVLSSPPATGATYNTTLGYLAVAGIVGLFTEETIVKIQEVAQTILGKKQDQKDPLDPSTAAAKPAKPADGAGS